MVRVRKGNPRLLIAALPSLLGAQALPPVPVVEPLDAPTAVDLLPLRPYRLERGPGFSRIPFDWRGDRVHEAGDVWTLEHGAIQAEGILLLADRIDYRITEGRLIAEGHIRLESPDLRLRGARLEMNWALRTGEAWALQMDLPPTWTLKSSHVAFTTLRTWAFDEVELSPCPEEKPGWKTKLSSLKVELDGFATLWNAFIQLGSTPVFYVPYAVYPAKAERTSGLLTPQLGVSSDYGLMVGMPYYQVLGPSADVTFSPEYLSKEGMLWGGEARWRPDLTHQGSVAGMTIHQRSLDMQRYRYVLKEVWQREDGWQLTADVNQASDNLVESDFGRSFGSLGAPIFDSALYIGKNFTFGSLSLNAAEQRSFFYTKDQGDPFYSPTFPASLRRQTLPQGEFRFFPVQVLGPLYLDGGVRAGHFVYQYEGSAVTPDGSFGWGREDANIRLHGRIGQWGPFRADFETMARGTHYGATLASPVFDPTAGPEGTVVDPVKSPFLVTGPATNRWLMSGHFRLSGPQVARDFEGLSLLGYSGELKHTAEPYFGVTGTSEYGDAGFIPRYDAVDAYPGVNDSATGERSFEVGLKQHLFGRSGKGTTFTDLARLKIAARFYATPVILGDGRYKQGWSSLDTELDVEPDNRWRLSFRRSSDFGPGGADNSLSVDVKSNEGGRFNLAYFSTGVNQFLVRQQGFQFGGLQRFWEDRFRLEFSASYDFRTKGFANSEVALAYVEPCVAYTLKFTHVALNSLVENSSHEDRLDFTITLRGLGELFNFRY